MLTIICCHQSKIDKKAEGEKIMQISKDWSQAASKGDIKKIVSYWADNAFMMSAGQSPLKGKQAIW